MPLTLGCNCSCIAQFGAVLLDGHAPAARHAMHPHQEGHRRRRSTKPATLVVYFHSTVGVASLLLVSAPDTAASIARFTDLTANPRVLHLATHGFYQAAVQPQDRPMLLTRVVPPAPTQREVRPACGAV